MASVSMLDMEAEDGDRLSCEQLAKLTDAQAKKLHNCYDMYGYPQGAKYQSTCEIRRKVCIEHLNKKHN